VNKQSISINLIFATIIMLFCVMTWIIVYPAIYDKEPPLLELIMQIVTTIKDLLVTTSKALA
jgi:hypothetical protein